MAKVFWTNDERELIAIQLVDQFKKKNLPIEKWEVTARAFMEAQSAIMSDDRFRAKINTHEMVAFQERVNRIGDDINKEQNSAIVKAYREFIKEHNAEPTTVVFQLKAVIEKLTTNAIKAGNELTATKDELSKVRVELETFRSQVNSANNIAAECFQKVGTLTASIKVEKPKNVEVPGFTKPLRTKYLIAANHLNSFQKSLVENAGEIRWIHPQDNSTQASKLAVGRMALVIENHIPTHVGRAIRSSADGYHVFRTVNQLTDFLREKHPELLMHKA